MGSFYMRITCDFDRVCLPGDMARACSLSLISFPWASARCKIVWSFKYGWNKGYHFLFFKFFCI